MSKRYQIWDKVSEVLVPTGDVFTASEWKNRYPISKRDNIDLVVSGGTINGSFCNEYTSFVDIYDQQMKSSNIDKYSGGIPVGLTKQETLDLIEEFEDAVSGLGAMAASPDERIAAALEAQVLLSM